MGLRDKAENQAQDVKGKGKETLGKLIDDEELEREGKTDQAKAAGKDAAEKVKDAAGKVKDAITGHDR